MCRIVKEEVAVEDDVKVKNETPEPQHRFNYSKWLRNIAILAVLGGILLLFYYNNADFRFNINYLVDILSHGDMLRLKYYLLSFGPWAAVISFLLMMFHMVLAPFPSVVITLTNGYLFGVFWGTLLSWSSSMAGAVLCFYIARLAGRPAVERFIGNKAINAAENFFKRYGNNSVLIARLIPAVSFDAVSYVAGITSISLWGFFWASAIGELPATIVYSWLGQDMSTTAKFIFWAFVGVAALLVLGFTIKKAFDRRMANKLKKDAKIAEKVGADTTAVD
jgi:uncharacterized membrane protein YdjX (TVP38/TMEM64 family)